MSTVFGIPHYTCISDISPGPSCSKHCLIKDFVNDKLVNCCSLDIFKYIDIFAVMQKQLKFFQQKISVFLSYFKTEIFKVTLDNNFIKF